MTRIEPAIVRSFRSALLPMVVMLLVAHSTIVRAADLPVVHDATPTLGTEDTKGKAYYVEGEFKKAAAEFQLTLAADPTNAGSYYWMGMAYQILADLNAPLDRKYRSKARFCLSKAVALAPDRSDYRRALFTFLLDASGRSFSRQAADLLRSVPESDPDYIWMRASFENAKRANSAIEGQLGTWLLAGPQAIYWIADLPVSSMRGRKTGR